MMKEKEGRMAIIVEGDEGTQPILFPLFRFTGLHKEEGEKVKGWGNLAQMIKACWIK